MAPKWMALWAVLATAVLGTPSTAQLKSDVSILIDNDLLGASSPLTNSGVLFLGSKQTLDKARAACESLGESLWSPESDGDIQSGLNYLVYQKRAKKSSKYWVAPDGVVARSISASGEVSEEDGSSRLPALCTQTAPVSNTTAQDASEQWQVSVQANNENLIGFRDRHAFRFLGVRYAQEPKRFDYAEAHKGDGGDVSALEYGAQCFQYGSGSEDCLFLNIWTPYLPRTKCTQKKNLKPVMFWIHGGAFTGGSANDHTFDGSNIVSRGDVILVAINYRLGKLGFLALDDGETNGNYGLADITLALDWVRANIQNFGGDPDRITVFGQSAGAGATRALIASPEAKGKFAGAIPLSNLGGLGYGTTYSKYLTISEAAERGGNTFVEAANCTDAPSPVDCLREVPLDKIGSLGGEVRFLVVDGKYLTSDELPLSGDVLDVNLMMGITAEDGAPMISFQRDITLEEQEEWIISQGYPYPSDPELYPLPELDNTTMAVDWAGARLATDAVFRCVDQATVAAALANSLLSQVYYYEFDRTYQTPGWPKTDLCEPEGRPDGNPSSPPGYLRCHSGELLYVFGNIVREGLPLRDEAEDLAFAQLTLDSFASFARTFDPNPDRAFLEARGFASTLAAVERAGKWEPAVDGDLKLKVFDWPEEEGNLMEGFRSIKQCEWLGLGLDYYL